FSIIFSISVIPGNIGAIKHTVRIPESYTCFIAVSLCSILDALSISLLNVSSRVLIDQETVTSFISFKISKSLVTSSDFVQIVIFASLFLSCSSKALVLRYFSSEGLYPSVTEPITTLCPAYFCGFFISSQYFTSRNVPHGSVCPVQRFINVA